jgi:hypothetical protein
VCPCPATEIRELEESGAGPRAVGRRLGPGIREQGRDGALELAVLAHRCDEIYHCWSISHV